MTTKFKVLTLLLTLLLLGACDDDTENACGNGQLDPGEACDPAMEEYASTCTEECTLAQFCGNGIVEGDEECDDGNQGNDDACSRECKVLIGCGNGYIDFTTDPETGRLFVEECDDNNVLDGDGCSASCTLESGAQTCGNGLLEFPENCDDGNTTDGDGCDSSCDVELGCGDGSFNSAIEECEDGNTINGDGCSSKCIREYLCGDGVCDEAQGETCDLCPSDCCENCGDGILSSTEECDDGNNDHFDGCSAGCFDEDQVATCGNGIWEITEECDDGNTDDGDGCDSTCVREFEVGDGTCETDRNETCRLSPNDCCPQCGDGNSTIEAGEQCDGANLNGLTCEDLCYDGGTLACTEYCEFDFSGCTGTGPICGDNEAECSEQCDGTDLKGKDCMSFGFAEGTLACTNGCEWDTSGCSGFMHYLMENFDDGQTPSGWTIHGSTWDLGTPTSAGGPSAAASAPYAIGTDLSAQYPTGMNYSSDYVELPPLDFSNATSPVLTFQGWLDTETGWDGGTVLVSTDGGLQFNEVSDTAVSPAFESSSELWWTGSAPSWSLYTVNLTSFVGQTVIIRFAFSSDGSGPDFGWFIDDILITEE